MSEHVLVRGLPVRSASAGSNVIDQVLDEFGGNMKDANGKPRVKALVIALRRIRTLIKLRGTISAEARSALCNKLVEWMVLPDTQDHTMIKICQTLDSLLAKRYEGVQLNVEWRKVWSIFERFIERSRLSEELCSSSSKSPLDRLVSVCCLLRYYYPESVITEVTETAYEFFQDPLSRDVYIGQIVLHLFLPSCRSDVYHRDGHLDRWLELWSKAEQASDWDNGWLYLFKRVFKWGNVPESFLRENMGELQRRILASLELARPVNISARSRIPVNLSPLAAPSTRRKFAAKIAVSMLGVGSAAEFYATSGLDDLGLTPNSVAEVEKCLAADESFSAGLLFVRRLLSSTQTLFHPSNSGSSHAHKVVEFVEMLVRAFARRLGRERAAAAGHSPFGCSDLKPLSAADKRAFVDALLPLLVMGTYSKRQRVSGSSEHCINQLAFLAPVTVSRRLLPVVAQALDPSNLSQTHQAPAAIMLSAVVLQPLLQARPLMAESLAEILELTLPGIDPNDMRKTITTNMLYQVVLGWVPIIDVDGLDSPSTESLKIATRSMALSASFGIDSAEDEAQLEDEGPLRDAMWRAAPALVDWSLRCLDRILYFIDNQVQSAKKGLAARMDSAVNNGLALTALLLLSQMSQPVLERAGARINEWCLDSCNLNAIRESKSLVRSYAVAVLALKDQSVFERLVMQGLFLKLAAAAESADTSDRKREWSLALLGGITRCAGAHLLPVEDRFLAMIDTCLKHDEASVRKFAGKLIRRSMRGLCDRFVASWSCNPAISSNDGPALARAAMTWAQPAPWAETCEQLRWQEPSQDKLAMARRIKAKYLDQTLDRLEKMMSSSAPLKKQEVRQELEVLFQVLRGMGGMEEVSRTDRMALLSRVSDLLAWLLRTCESDTVSHRRAIKCLQVLLFCFGASSSSTSKLMNRKSWFQYMRELVGTSEAYCAELRACADHLLVHERADYVVPRFNQVDDVQTLYHWQLYQRSSEMFEEAKEKGDEEALSYCFEIATLANEHAWDDTRAAAASLLRTIMVKAPWFGKAQVATLIRRSATPAKDEDDHGRIMGGWSLLKSSRVVSWISGSWELRDLLFRQGLLGNPKDMVAALAQDKQKAALDAIQGVLVSVLSNWRYLPELSDADTRLREGMLSDLVDPARNRRLDWRQQQLACVLLFTLTRPKDDSAISSSMLSWLAGCVGSEMQPLRATAANVLVKSFRRVPAKKAPVLAKQLDLGADFFRSLSNALALAHKSSNASANNGSSQSSRAKWSLGVTDLLQISRVRGSQWYPRTNTYGVWSSEFKYMHKLLVEQLCGIHGVSSTVSALLPQFHFLLKEDTHTAEHPARVSAACELFAGVLAAAATAQIAAKEFVPELLDLMEDHFYTASDEHAKQWMDAVRACGNTDVQLELLARAQGRLKACLASKGDDVSQAVTAVNLLRLARTVLLEVPFARRSEYVDVARPIIALLEDSLANPFETVRGGVGKTWVSAVDMLLLLELDNAEDLVSDSTSKILAAVAALPPPSREACPASSTLDTALSIVSWLVVSGSQRLNNLVFPSFASVVLKAQGHPNQDVGKHAKLAGGCACSLAFSDRAAAIAFLRNVAGEVQEEAEDGMEVDGGQVSGSSSGKPSGERWYTRLAVATVLATSLNANEPMLGYAAAAVHARKEVEKLLRDPQVEVHKVASEVLTRVFSTFMPDSPSLSVSKDRYVKLASTKIKKDQLKTEDGKARLKKRLTGVLGLAAIVKAFPYSVPFPDAVVTLAKRVNDPNPVGPSAKDAIQSFKHTHTDSWEETKTHFTRDELEDLQDTSYSGSHA